jgi:hypothetical protein
MHIERRLNISTALAGIEEPGNGVPAFPDDSPLRSFDRTDSQPFCWVSGTFGSRRAPLGKPETIGK